MHSVRRPVRGPPDHLNSTGCRIAYSEGKGRGVYASRDISAGTLIEISPVLLFTQNEYKEHGQFTVLDHYTFKWPDGRMALALGLGSLFNHSESPNVSFQLDTDTESIRYVTSRYVAAGQELYIFYGHKLWFEDVDRLSVVGRGEEVDDGWGGLSGVGRDETDASESSTWSVVDGKAGDGVHVDDLPFTRVRIAPDDDEEDKLDAIRLVDVWVMDIADSRQIATLLRWIRQNNLEDSSLSHLKRIRKSANMSSLLLAPLSLFPEPPSLPDEMNLPAPYIVTVPRNAALTQVSLKLKNTMWPTVYAPRKKWEPEPWSKGKVRWAWEAMQMVVREAKLAKDKGDLPIVAYVPPAYDADAQDLAQIHSAMSAHDTRQSASHPLRHAVLNLIRIVADYRASVGAISETPPVDLSSDPVPSPPVPISSVSSPEPASSSRNGSHYLLTSLTLFTTHEPCIMCSMALLHSRVKEVFYLIPMEKTGGCGGLACVPRLDGVNHRFGINVWKEAEGGVSSNGIELDEAVDA
ncbi:hypothetical protein BXZ70DRAFT_998726 [Cristinia sonorae]|uniref:SET domain-containing protein n=1 Tax=Cristinia sonorae TaxID=1940300 RepID=A0A8K0UV09_9AGAR|nr:hypothetical protein BXZ70DRAFT_998726 [Cristinia sonorae]